MCALYGVTRVGYYAWRARGGSARREQDRVLVSTIRAIFDRSHGTYGSPRIHQALRAAGTRVSRRRTERLMREAGLRARARTLYRRIPGLHGFFTSIPNRQLDRLATGPDQVWVGDITYVRVAGAWRYLAVVMDRYSRRIIGWSLGAAKDARLTLAAFNHAVLNRRPGPGVIFHSDRGVEYAAYAFRNRLAALGFVQSMNRPREIVLSPDEERRRPRGQLLAPRSARAVAPEHIPYYNGVRLHSGIGYCSPVDYEAQAR